LASGGTSPRSTQAGHRFRQIDDPGIGAFAVSRGHELGLGGIDAIDTTDSFIGKSRCGVPGYGGYRHDPSHRTESD